MTEQRNGKLHHPVAGAGLVEQRAEQHEQENETRRHPECDAEHTFRDEPLMREEA